MGDWDQNSLINELLHGMELVRQLQMYLHVPSSPQETRELLIQKIIEAFEKALAMVNWKSGPVGEPSQMPTRVAIPLPESPPLSGSPRSDDADRGSRDQKRSASGKRKTMPTWTKQIRVNPGTGVEGPLDDGYGWRKYGQKDILGAKYPRGYYRCTHRNVQGCMATKQVQRSDQGCMATKQVQRSDEDPTIFEITYRGKHTCTMASNVVPNSEPQENQEANLSTGPHHQNGQQSLEQQSNDLLLNLRAGLRVLTENLDHVPEQPFAPFHFPSTSNIRTENQANFPAAITENQFAVDFIYPSYVFPATSGATYFSVSPSGGNSFRGHPHLASSGPEINDMISVAISAANSPAVALEFPFDQFELDGENFTFGDPRFS